MYSIQYSSNHHQVSCRKVFNWINNKLCQSKESSCFPFLWEKKKPKPHHCFIPTPRSTAAAANKLLRLLGGGINMFDDGSCQKAGPTHVLYDEYCHVLGSLHHVACATHEWLIRTMGIRHISGCGKPAIPGHDSPIGLNI